MDLMRELGIGVGNRLRNGLGRGLLGRVARMVRPAPALRRITFVSATRLTEKAFWKGAALGRSIGLWKEDANVKVHVHCENRRGLPEIFNGYLDDAHAGDILVFLHDDVWLNDHSLLEKLRVALRRYDVVGVAGNRRRLPGQVSWIFVRRDESGFVMDDWANLSGTVTHGKPGVAAPSVYGPSPASCELLDGVFLAVRADVARRSGLRFDDRFTFDFYDLDLCRSARRKGMSVGTWPLDIIHESGGEFGKASWEAALAVYLKKWRK